MEYFILGLLPALATLIWMFTRKQPELDVALLTDENGDFSRIMKKGHDTFRDKLFKIPTSNKPMVIVPTHLLDDLKAYPEETISFRREMYDRFLGKYTAVASNSHAMVQAVKVDLTRAMGGNVLPTLQDEAIFAVKECLPDQEDWTPITLYSATTRMIALLSGRVFVGLPLSRNEEWINMSINATIDSFVGAAMMWAYPSWSWPIMQYIVPQTRRVKEYRVRAAQLLKPVIDVRLAAMQTDSFKKPADMIQWLIDNSNGKGSDLAFQANEHIVVNIAAIHTTGGQLAHTLFDLARHPEYIEPLREEIKQVFGPGEASAQQVTKQSLFKLKKLDSFLREVQRLNPPSMVSTNRKVLKPMKLSNGVSLPVGTSLAASAGCVSRDPSIWENPEQFDGFRFEKLRQQGDETKYQFASIGQDALSFGHGRHACPGRFFASAEIKIVLVQILQNYDIRLSPGSEGRPLYRFQEIMAAPDHTFQLEFRKIRRKE